MDNESPSASVALPSQVTSVRPAMGTSGVIVTVGSEPICHCFGMWLHQYLREHPQPVHEWSHHPLEATMWLLNQVQLLRYQTKGHPSNLPKYDRNPDRIRQCIDANATFMSL